MIVKQEQAVGATVRCALSLGCGGGVYVLDGNVRRM